MCNPNLVDQLGYIMSCGVGDIKLLDVAVEARMFFCLQAIFRGLYHAVLLVFYLWPIFHCKGSRNR